MEKIEEDLEATESKQRTLLKAYESVHSQASSLIIFSVLWKDLEDHFNSTRSSIETRFREILTREGEVGAREKQLDAKASDFHSEMESKAGDLHGLEKLKEQKLKEVIDSKNHLHSLMSLIKEHSDEVIVQEERLMEVENFVREKEGELDSVDRRIKERTKKLNWVDKIMEEKSKLAECKEKEVRGFQEVLDKYVKDIELKQRELNEMVGSVEERRKEFDLKEEEIKAVNRSIKECEKELELKEEKLRLVGKSLVECLNMLESKEKMVREIDLKERDFSLLKNSMEEWSCKLEFKERELELKEKQVESNIGELKLVDKRVSELKEKHLELQKSRQEGEKHLDTLSRGLQMKEMQLKDWAKELELQQKELDSIKQSTEEHNQSLKSKERQLEEQAKELELKKQELDSIKKSTEEDNQSLKSRERQLEDQAKDLELKKKEVDSIKKSTEEHNQSLKLKERQLEDEVKDLELKKKEVDTIKKSTEEHNQSLKLKERQLEDEAKDLELKQKEFDLIKNSTEEHTQNLKSKERQLEQQAKQLKLRQKKFESIKKSTAAHTQNLKSNKRQLEDQAKELELRNKEFDSIKKSIEEHTQNLISKERQLEDQAKDLQRKQKEFDLIKKSTEEHTQNLKSKQNTSILHSQVKIEQLEHIPANNAIVPSFASNQSSSIKDGRGLQLFMNEHLKRSDLAGSEIWAVLQESSDPAKLVLNAMQGFYPSNLAVDNRECDFDLRVVRRSCVLLLEELKRFAPQINPQVKEEAIKLAGEWKAKMTTATENWLEVLGFLRLVTSYDITSDFDVKELQCLLAIVSMHEQATELSQALGTTEEASASICYSPVKTATLESSLAKSPATVTLESSLAKIPATVTLESSLAESPPTVSSSNHSLTATKDERNLQAFLNQVLSGNHLIKDDTLAALQRSSDPEKIVLDVMQNSFAQYWRNGDTGSKETIMLNYINLLEQLMGVLPHVGHHVKEDATQLAVQWKAKMGADTEKPLELLSFLQFIATYGLLSTLATDDIVMILGRISQNKQSRELCQTLSFAEKIPSHFIRNLIEKKQLINVVKVICTFKLIDTFPPEPLLEKFVQNARNWHKKICIKKKSLDEKEKVINDEITDLRTVIQCIKDCNLESKYPSRSIEILIDSLEKRKEYWRRSATSLGSNGGKVEQEEEKKSLNCKGGEEPKKSVQQEEQRIPIAFKVEQEEQRIPIAPKVVQQEQRVPIASKVVQQNQKKGKKRRIPRQQQQQYQNKFQRTSEPAARPYPMPTCPPNYPRRSFSPWPHENYSCPGQQFGMADSDFGMGANCGHLGQFGMPANDYQTGGMQNSGMHHSYPLMRSPPSYGSY